MREKIINNDDRVSFLLYKSYAEQLNLLSDEQAGKLIKAVYTYACTEIMPETDDLAIKLMLLSICNQLDIDAKKYIETAERRREAGRKGGLQRAKNYIEASNAKNAKANQADKEKEKEEEKEEEYEKEIEIENEDEEVNEIEEVNEKEKKKEEEGEKDHDHDKEIKKEIDCAAPTDRPKIISFTANQHPTTQQEVDKAEALAQELFQRYTGQPPGPYDTERVFECVYSRAAHGEDGYIATYDDEKAELLRYAFEAAVKAGKVNWNYIGGIYNNFDTRGIKTMHDVERYERNRKYGEEEFGLLYL